MPPVLATNKQQSNGQYVRETVESVIVAFILAFLFRAFVAEAFVIPTGSMAPTLMGAHKDLTCADSGVSYQVGASIEYDNSTGMRNGQAVVGSTAALNRSINPIDMNDPNQATFSGDRILVSKFDYVFSKPKRWDVLVFKFPGEARMNYIKRLIGLPNEQLLIQEGDIYVRPDDAAPWNIARKPAHKAVAMRQPVSDTNYLSRDLVELGYPSLWQPWPRTNDNNWQVQQDKSGWSAKLQSSTEVNWLRYYHKELSDLQWLDVKQNQRLPSVAADQSTLVTDYLAYNSFFVAGRPMQMTESDLVNRFNAADNGMHWVGDLTGEFEIDIQSNSGTLLFQLVEFGIIFELAIDVSTGQAKLRAADGTAVEGQPQALTDFFSGQNDLVAATKIRGPGRYHVGVANVDEQILVWVNHRLIKFNQPAEFDSWQVRDQSQRRPQWSDKDPLDAAPIAVGGQGLSMQVHRAQVFRDLYYIALRGHATHEYGGDLDLLQNQIPELAKTRLGDAQILRYVYSHPELWQNTPLFSYRQRQTFQLGEGQYFPMGDNSAQSSDARMWNQNYVDEKFLLGKALMVFWPHPWNRPIPYFPNFPRMGLIR